MTDRQKRLLRNSIERGVLWWRDVVEDPDGALRGELFRGIDRDVARRLNNFPMLGLCGDAVLDRNGRYQFFHGYGDRISFNVFTCDESVQFKDKYRAVHMLMAHALGLNGRALADYIVEKYDSAHRRTATELQTVVVEHATSIRNGVGPVAAKWLPRADDGNFRNFLDWLAKILQVTLHVTVVSGMRGTDVSQYPRNQETYALEMVLFVQFPGNAAGQRFRCEKCVAVFCDGRQWRQHFDQLRRGRVVDAGHRPCDFVAFDAALDAVQATPDYLVGMMDALINVVERLRQKGVVYNAQGVLYTLAKSLRAFAERMGAKFKNNNCHEAALKFFSTHTTADVNCSRVDRLVASCEEMQELVLKTKQRLDLYCHFHERRTRGLEIMKKLNNESASGNTLLSRTIFNTLWKRLVEENLGHAQVQGNEQPQFCQLAFGLRHTPHTCTDSDPLLRDWFGQPDGKVSKFYFTREASREVVDAHIAKLKELIEFHVHDANERATLLSAVKSYDALVAEYVILMFNDDHYGLVEYYNCHKARQVGVGRHSSEHRVLCIKMCHRDQVIMFQKNMLYTNSAGERITAAELVVRLNVDVIDGCGYSGPGLPPDGTIASKHFNNCVARLEPWACSDVHLFISSMDDIFKDQNSNVWRWMGILRNVASYFKCDVACFNACRHTYLGHAMSMHQNKDRRVGVGTYSKLCLVPRDIDLLWARLLKTWHQLFWRETPWELIVAAANRRARLPPPAPSTTESSNLLLASDNFHGSAPNYLSMLLKNHLSDHHQFPGDFTFMADTLTSVIIPANEKHVLVDSGLAKLVEILSALCNSTDMLDAKEMEKQRDIIFANLVSLFDGDPNPSVDFNDLVYSRDRFHCPQCYRKHGDCRWDGRVPTRCTTVLRPELTAVRRKCIRCGSGSHQLCAPLTAAIYGGCGGCWRKSCVCNRPSCSICGDGQHVMMQCTIIPPMFAFMKETRCNTCARLSDICNSNPCTARGWADRDCWNCGEPFVEHDGRVTKWLECDVGCRVPDCAATMGHKTPQHAFYTLYAPQPGPEVPPAEVVSQSTRDSVGGRTNQSNQDDDPTEPGNVFVENSEEYAFFGSVSNSAQEPQANCGVVNLKGKLRSSWYVRDNNVENTVLRVASSLLFLTFPDDAFANNVGFVPYTAPYTKDFLIRADDEFAKFFADWFAWKRALLGRQRSSRIVVNAALRTLFLKDWDHELVPAACFSGMVIPVIPTVAALPDVEPILRDMRRTLTVAAMCAVGEIVPPKRCAYVFLNQRTSVAAGVIHSRMNTTSELFCPLIYCAMGEHINHAAMNAYIEEVCTVGGRMAGRAPQFRFPTEAELKAASIGWRICVGTYTYDLIQKTLLREWRSRPPSRAGLLLHKSTQGRPRVVNEFQGVMTVDLVPGKPMMGQVPHIRADHQNVILHDATLHDHPQNYLIDAISSVYDLLCRRPPRPLQIAGVPACLGQLEPQTRIRVPGVPGQTHVAADGHCLFHCLAEYARRYPRGWVGSVSTMENIRDHVLEWLDENRKEIHPPTDDRTYEDLLADSLGDNATFDDAIDGYRSGAWSGEEILSVVPYVFQSVRLHVHQLPVGAAPGKTYRPAQEFAATVDVHVLHVSLARDGPRNHFDYYEPPQETSSATSVDTTHHDV